MPKGTSVVIPAYNEAIDIASCLKAFSKQSVAPKEIILVDNNCTDDTVKIASSFPLVRIVKEKNKGITYARTAGFNAAKYDIIARTDADTLVAPDWIEKIEKHFGEDKALQGITGAVSARELSPGNTQWFKSLSTFTRWVARKAIKYNREYPLMVGHNMAIRRSAWQQVASKVHLGDKDINEDVDASLFIQSVGKVAFFKDMIVKTRLMEMFFHPRKQLGYKHSIMHTFDLHK